MSLSGSWSWNWLLDDCRLLSCHESREIGGISQIDLGWRGCGCLYCLWSLISKNASSPLGAASFQRGLIRLWMPEIPQPWLLANFSMFSLLPYQWML